MPQISNNCPSIQPFKSLARVATKSKWFPPADLSTTFSSAKITPCWDSSSPLLLGSRWFGIPLQISYGIESTKADNGRTSERSMSRQLMMMTSRGMNRKGSWKRGKMSE
ncbi:hypothetical protein QTJ16_006684 [Diplocarpon rosae]|uniref:Uncharacterized protein n=1 Tax=Diplocarpon rosae TaxID=946125 RepID=A0AAD9SWL9_9HELO|nr:hypothetical protein QTJ16_006684 [Diplocarpon rosae]